MKRCSQKKSLILLLIFQLPKERNFSAIERHFSQCTSLCHFVFSSSEKETLFSKEVVNESEDYVDAPWSPTHEVECTYRSSSFAFSKNDSLMTL